MQNAYVVETATRKLPTQYLSYVRGEKRLSYHLCSTCHRFGTDCRSPVWQSRMRLRQKSVRTLTWRIWQIMGIDLPGRRKANVDNAELAPANILYVPFKDTVWITYFTLGRSFRKTCNHWCVHFKGSEHRWFPPSERTIPTILSRTQEFLCVCERDKIVRIYINF